MTVNAVWEQRQGQRPRQGPPGVSPGCKAEVGWGKLGLWKPGCCAGAEAGPSLTKLEAWSARQGACWGSEVSLAAAKERMQGQRQGPVGESKWPGVWDWVIWPWLWSSRSQQ